MPTIMPTVTRIPRMQGLPPMTFGSDVILVSFMLFIVSSKGRISKTCAVIRLLNDAGSQ